MARFKGGLGRGLDALLASTDTPPAETLATLEIDRLQPGRYQPRTRMDEASLAELAQSIRSQGLMQPILVRPVDTGGYEIIAGERRWRAARLAGLTEVPAVIREVADEAALAMALIENIQRENLSPIEEAAGIRRLVDEFGMTHERAADAVGRSRSALTNLLRLLTLADAVQQMLLDGRIDMGHARALLALAPAQQVEAAHVVALKQLSVRETERLVKALVDGRAAKPARPVDRDIVRLQEEVSERLGAPVTIRAGSSGRGRIVIDYATLDELDAILSRF